MPEMMKIGQRILRQYKVQDLLAEGGQASIAKGTDRKTKKPVIIKQLSTGPEDPNHTDDETCDGEPPLLASNGDDGEHDRDD